MVLSASSRAEFSNRSRRTNDNPQQAHGSSHAADAVEYADHGAASCELRAGEKSLSKREVEKKRPLESSQDQEDRDTDSEMERVRLGREGNDSVGRGKRGRRRKSGKREMQADGRNQLRVEAETERNQLTDEAEEEKDAMRVGEDKDAECANDYHDTEDDDEKEDSDSDLSTASPVQSRSRSSEGTRCGKDPKESNDWCTVCKMEGHLIVCDGADCKDAFHLECCYPPMLEVPEGEWYCLRCELQVDQNRGSDASSDDSDPEIIKLS